MPRKSAGKLNFQEGKQHMSLAYLTTIYTAQIYNGFFSYTTDRSVMYLKFLTKLIYMVDFKIIKILNYQTRQTGFDDF